MLGKGSVVFQSITVRTSTDNVEPIFAQLVLKLTSRFGNVLKEDYAIVPGRANLVELALPIRGVLHEASHSSSS